MNPGETASLRRRRGEVGNSQAKGPDSDVPLESESIVAAPHCLPEAKAPKRLIFQVQGQGTRTFVRALFSLNPKFKMEVSYGRRNVKKNCAL